MNPRFDDSSFTVAIVGCGGFIGSHLLDAVLERTRWRVFGVDLDFYRLQHRLNHERCEFLCADLADPAVVERIAQFPLVVNLAAICTPSRYMGEACEVIRSNYDHPAALASACAKSGSWLVHFSTSEIYGRTTPDSDELIEDETPVVFGPVAASRWSYATAKLLAERFIAGLPGLKWTVVRPFNFVGPYMDFMPGVDGEGIPRVLANFSTALLRGEPLKLVNGGMAKRSFTSVHDAVDFLFALFAAGSGAQGAGSETAQDASSKTVPNSSVFSQAFNVGNPENEVSIAELAQKMRTIFAKLRGVDVSTLPEPQSVSGEEYYGAGYDDSMRRMPSVAKAQRLLGFKARIPLDVALEESLSWFVKHYSVEQ
ncbi:NAD-dependent epimerase/dehydratase family protein [Fibrobacter sp. UWR2]|uniref:NAD-dependent epimerase/dehydratase family protein n=1 Tax=Fibrobacter sp. UWR2 TaxID=1964352 RepID=UPI000B51F38C|nr:NAD-dependent epimerase/dehydratase family protein [Fibrobacter sp. UWR2]OWV01055.1 epimerase [Fibrobacter sp. UWR2]